MTAAFSAPTGATASNAAPSTSKGLALLAIRLANVSLDDIAKALHKDDTAASRVRSGQREITVHDLDVLIQLCGLKLVDREKVCVDRKAYESMTYIASKALANQQVSQTLIWDEGEG